MRLFKGQDDDEDELPQPPPEPKGPCPAGGQHNYQREGHLMVCQNAGCNSSYVVA